MKKYIVKINYASGHIDIVTLKAKNGLDLEVKIAKELKNIFGTLDEINSIEYEQVRHFTFKKKDYHWFVEDTYVGGMCLEEILERNK